ncbi:MULTISPECIES: 4-aminobutyrate--2-oxoglutarate transaminase [Halomonadaceae]|jgi:4-aminobutyrate aminotransferase / (S)-3-amino-2-methylpropionate transaminase / 5-aminovalerate transaminase|uniref:4-aminobutyrate--2-oxoglutarate transaminase n=1 Tax=Halomonadaceae TaxID=28256 RepID=UPI0012F19361|nr:MULTISPECIES: 4-aminobutyrate--2-oxoglutarate transaminase [Halomonas]CAD5259697.1 4-aminobutyrate aminotransferase, PLP-dependent [Halomonas sp. 59]CAD5259961.1 4-aminobutyrate aminotransferase, PLP-dependent [Halomonas sp. 113]CAD5273952.1 4-aminobutyrate aminotransferase, PLP-dependent [Halomonas sp. I3]CAD5288737.1 4-aminobutyrate aminotransferase, PLP-dependent [Halomonas sp. 156]VXB36985.1 4-aminobutyrate aminotransferase, PLP-dependent [Halomonas titanicae]
MTSDANSSHSMLRQREQSIPRGVVNAHPIVISHARGSEVFDADGQRYLDFVGGIGVLNVGHNHPRVVAAVQAQVERISHMSFQVAAYPGYIELASQLAQLVGGDNAYQSVLFTSGAEAVENAIKIARSHTGRPNVIAFRGGFHGRTLLGTTLTGMSQPYRQNFGPFAPAIHHVSYPDPLRGVSSEDVLAELETLFATEVVPDQVAAILIEPVQGDGGFLPAPVEFMQALRALTERHGIVLIADEIQTGFGRTGKMFGFEHSNILPDLVTVAKSLGGGLPISGVVGRTEMMQAPAPGGLGGTYGGSALSCAAALAVLNIFADEQLLERGIAMGKRLETGLRQLQAKHPLIAEVRGQGPMLAIELIKGPQAIPEDATLVQQVIDNCRGAGLLVIKCGVYRNVIRFLAPLNTSDQQTDEALEILDKALSSAAH